MVDMDQFERDEEKGNGRETVLDTDRWAISRNMELSQSAS